MRPDLEREPVPGSAVLPAVTVICPTYQRPNYLRRQVENFLAQTYSGELEMLILDDSPEPSAYLLGAEYRERGVRYLHMPAERLTIGYKLRTMASLARGGLIAVFDDDDYYAPRYLERMVEFLGDADFCTLSRWFAYSPEQRTFAYWATDTLSPAHHVFSPWEPITGVPIPTQGWNPDWVTSKLWGYGFSYIWRTSISARAQIGDITFDEVCWDWDFYQQVQNAGLKTVCAPDNEGLIMHILHPGATSKMFPQYILPEFMLGDYFPLYTPVES
ncbi:glycosyltransferase family 2 protein [Nocardia sp. alder85J]|uniref:glycosyltransferase family 2 protein n=1 Tax=Nocardia sp. alder85J TaxID=2862949 RepID=UPI001CD2C598|nr:glycosyltransferase family 2 protein [Nocardia sp. alder85J]MCX4092574.1 glycosyltransferase family 2 protein [Nocardia sp. alder85J]